MGVFSGLLNGLLGGGGGLGDLASKAMNIGSKLINRKEGESFGDALVGQLPAIASGLGGLAKSYGGMIPGIGGIVSKIGEVVEEGAKEFEEPEKVKEMKDFGYKTWEDLPMGARSDARKMYALFRSISDDNKDMSGAIDHFNHLVEDLGNDFYSVYENGGFMGDNTSDGEIEQGPTVAEVQRKLDKKNVRYVNSPEELLRHASNNMPVMSGLANVHRLDEPARMDRRDIDYPTESRGNSSSNWRNFRPSQMDKIDPLHDMQADDMYSSNLPHITHKHTGKAQTIDDVQPVSFKKNFIR